MLYSLAICSLFSADILRNKINGGYIKKNKEQQSLLYQSYKNVFGNIKFANQFGCGVTSKRVGTESARVHEDPDPGDAPRAGNPVASIAC